MGKYTADGAMLWVLTSIETILVITISKDHKLQRKWHIHRIWPPGLSSHYFIVYYISHLTQGRPIGETWYFCEYFLKDFLNNSRNVGPKHSFIEGFLNGEKHRVMWTLIVFYGISAFTKLLIALAKQDKQRISEIFDKCHMAFFLSYFIRINISSKHSMFINEAHCWEL